MPDLHIVCLRPGGMHRGGKHHEGHKAHEPNAFTSEQLRELIADPNFVLIGGGERLTQDHVNKAEAAKAEAKAKAEKPAKA